MISIRELFWHDSSFGILGEEAGQDLHVGDVIAYAGDSIGLDISIVVRDVTEKEPFVMGWGGMSIDRFVEKHDILKVLPYDALTNEMLEYYSNMGKLDGYKIVEIKARELTIAEIEAELGYRIKILK